MLALKRICRARQRPKAYSSARRHVEKEDVVDVYWGNIHASAYVELDHATSSTRPTATYTSSACYPTSVTVARDTDDEEDEEEDNGLDAVRDDKEIQTNAANSVAAGA